MNLATKKIQSFLMENEPIVIVPVAVWDAMKDALAELKEDLEMYSSRTHVARIARARSRKKTYTSEEVRKRLGI